MVDVRTGYLQVAARSVTKGQRQQLRDILDGSDAGTIGGGVSARLDNSNKLKDMQPGVLVSSSGAAGATGDSESQTQDSRHRVTSRTFSYSSSAGTSGVPPGTRSPLGDGPFRGSAHHRATSKISSVMSGMPWNRNNKDTES
jgi:hypothetical protein